MGCRNPAILQLLDSIHHLTGEGLALTLCTLLVGVKAWLCGNPNWVTWLSDSAAMLFYGWHG